MSPTAEYLQLGRCSQLNNVYEDRLFSQPPSIMDHRFSCLAQGDHERQESNAVHDKTRSVSISALSSRNSSAPKSLVHRYAAINRHAKARLLRTIEYQKSQKEKAESSHVKTTRHDPKPISNDEENLHYIQALLSPNPNGLLRTGSKDPFQTYARSLDNFEYYLVDHCTYPCSDFLIQWLLVSYIKYSLGSHPRYNSRAKNVSLLSM